MERLPEDVVKKLKDFATGLESLGARSIVNYIIYEFEVGGPSLEVLTEAEHLANREIEELKEVVKLVKELKEVVYV
ncbi:MAG: hypothetical protein ACK4M3_01695 [Pyrobaculum sp.]